MVRLSFGEKMKTLIFTVVLLSCSISRAGDASDYRTSHLAAINDSWAAVAEKITIKKFRIKKIKWNDILPLIERMSKEGDTTGKGLHIFVPKEFKKRFEEIGDSEWTLDLADNLNIQQIFIEAPPPGWYYYPVTPREIAVIPFSELIQDAKPK